MATPGTYDVYALMKERLPEKGPRKPAVTAGLLKKQIVVPDFQNAEFNTSSMLVADKVNVLTRP